MLKITLHIQHFSMNKSTRVIVSPSWIDRTLSVGPLRLVFTGDIELTTPYLLEICDYGVLINLSGEELLNKSL